MQLADLPSPFGLVFDMAVKAKWHFHRYRLEYRTFGSCLIFAACGLIGSTCSYLCHNSENFPGNLSFVPRLIRTEGFGKRRDLFKHNVGRKYFLKWYIWQFENVSQFEIEINKPFTDSRAPAVLTTFFFHFKHASTSSTYSVHNLLITSKWFISL